MIKQLLTEHLDTWTQAVETKSAAGRGSSNKLKLHGIAKLRELILELAVRGQLVPQDENDEPASVLLERIAAERERLVKEKKIKKPKVLPEISEDDEFFEIPNNWEWVRLGHCAYVFSGNSFKSGDFNKESGARVIKITNAGVGEIVATNDYLPKAFLEQYEEFKVFKGDLILALTRPYIAKGLKVSICPDDFDSSLLNQRVAAIRPILGTRFLYQFLSSSTVLNLYRDRFNSSGLQPNLKMSDVTDLLIPVPPVNEQKRIVAKVDELMALCDALEREQESSIAAHEVLVENLLAALTNAADKGEFKQAWARVAEHFDTLFTTERSVDQLKQTILQLAVMGKLVEQDPADEPAGVLLERIAAEKARLVKEKKIKMQKALPEIGEEEKVFELPVGWEWCRIWDVAELITSGSRDWAKYYSDSGAIFVTMGNLSRGDYKLRMDTIRYVQPPEEGEGLRTQLTEHDLLISITGDVGNLGLIPENFGVAYINQHTCLLRFMPECQNKYFPELMRSPLAKRQYDAPQRGIKNSFRLGDVGEMVIPLPPPEEQKRIAAMIDQLMALCDQLQANTGKARNTQLQVASSLTDLVA